MLPTEEHDTETRTAGASRRARRPRWLDAARSAARSRANLRIRPRDPSVHRTQGFEPAEMLDAFDRTARTFVSLVRSLPAEAADLPVPGLDWTVGELVAHEVTVLRRAEDPRRGATVAELGALNQRCIEELTTRRLDELAERLDRARRDAAPIAAALPTLWRLGIGRWLVFRLHLGIWSDLPMTFAWPTADMLVHGHELAAATGADWTIDRHDAATVLTAALPQLLDGWAVPESLAGPTRRWSLRLRPDGPVVTVTVGRGQASVDFGSTGPVSATDPAHLLLAVMGRVEPSDEVERDLARVFQPV